MTDDRTTTSSALRADDQNDQIKKPEIHTQYVETYGRALLAAKGASEAVNWPNDRFMKAASTLAISDALAGRKIKTPGELVRALRSVLEIGGVNFADLDRRVGELEISMVAVHALDGESIRFVGQLVRLSLPEARRLFKNKKTQELRKALADMNLDFGMDIGDWTPPRIDESDLDAEAATEK